MKTLHCDYFTPKSLPTPDGEYWGVVGITNHSPEYVELYSAVSLDTGTNYKHHTHMHLNLRISY